MTPSVSPEAERELSEGALLLFSADALQPLERRGQVENAAAREAAKGYELGPACRAFRRQLSSYHDVIVYGVDVPEYALELLLAYDGRLHFFASGHYLKFEVKAVEKSRRVPHGIAYSLTLHAPDGKRLVGFDNAHPVPHRGGRHVRRKPEADHWHRTTGDKGRPYEFVSVERLLEDFFGEAERVLREQGVAFEIVTEKEG